MWVKTGQLMASRGSTTEMETEKFITHRSWRRYTAYLEGPCRRSMQSADRQVLGHISLSGSMVAVLTYPDYGWIGQFGKSRILVSFLECLISGSHIRHIDSGRQGKPLITRANICWWLSACYIRHLQEWGASVSLKSRQAPGQTQWMSGQQCPGVA